MTRASAEDAFKHLTENVFEWNSSTHGMKALDSKGYNTITYLVTMTEDEIDELEISNNLIPRVQRKLLFHALLYHDEECKKRKN